MEYVLTAKGLSPGVGSAGIVRNLALGSHPAFSHFSSLMLSRSSFVNYNPAWRTSLGEQVVRMRSYHGLWNWAAARLTSTSCWALLLVLFCGSLAHPTHAQVSDDPSDATPSLLLNTSAGVTTVLPTSGSGSCSVINGPFSTAGTSTAVSVNIARPTCGNFMDLPPWPPNGAYDVWMRVDQPAGAHSYRFTMFGGTMSNGAMAVYEATSATAPMRLIECAVGGSLTAQLPTLEVSCATPGAKLYLRVWNEMSRTTAATFYVCVQSQAIATMPSRGANLYETAALAAAAADYPAGNTSTGYTLEYAFACEDLWLQSDSAYVGGDLWLSFLVPTNGTVRMWVARGLTPSSRVEALGMSAYLTSNPNDATKFRQVGSLPSLSPTWVSATPNWVITCLPPNERLYIRIHSTKNAQTMSNRYGQFRFARSGGAGTTGPPANNQPCGATLLSFSGNCPVATTPTFNDNLTCNTPGIPDPGCGGFNASRGDLWYKFVAPASGTVQIDASPIGATPADPAMALYTAGNDCNGRYTHIECDDKQGLGNSARIVRTGLIPGRTYYVRAWDETSTVPTSGKQFTICITEPVPPAGHCFYVVDLWARYASTATTYQGVQAEINGGPPINMVTATGDEASQLFLLAVPTGASIFFQYYNNAIGEYKHSLYQLGDTARFWRYHGGVPVIGPSAGPTVFYTINNACQPIPRFVTDCLGAETICNPATEFGYVRGDLPPGNTFDLNGSNMGCLDVEDKGLVWMVFRPTVSGTVAFWFDGTTNYSTTDLDFAIWDTGPAITSPTLPNISGSICPPQAPPVRCSSARRNYSTGLLPGIIGLNQEGHGGWGWLSPLPVVANNIYLIALVRGEGTPPAVQYQMRWDYVGGGPPMVADVGGAPAPTMLDCTPLILPIELIALDATVRDEMVDVTWATTTERNSAYYLVEHGTDGRSFTPIGSMQAAGESIMRKDYLFTHPQPLRGVNYYRLRMVDKDGSFTHSDIVTAVIDTRLDRPLLFPNPTTGTVELYMHVQTSGPLLLTVHDATGRMVHNEAAMALEDAPLRRSLNLTMLATGAYQVQVLTLDGTPLGSARLMKQ